MSLSRRAALSFLAAAFALPARAEGGAIYWPVATDHPRWDVISAQPSCVNLRCFSAPRPVSQLENPRRHHAGVDLFAHAGDAVIAIEAGRVIDFYPFLRARTGEMSHALLIAHAGYVANYGEVRDPPLVSVGDEVAAGQRIARISDTAQLHFETYAPGSARNRSWPHGAPQPAGVIDPTERLRDLAQRGTRVLP
ncbi:MAG TPA: M23 family metallopeptidase [Terricaulis sp.]|nr:M23 family metallopeptidase [Terricaulis sp.]